MNVNELLAAVQTAYDDVQAKSAVRQDAAMALDAAVKAEHAAADYLADLQDQLSVIFAKVLPQSDPRFRKSA